MQSFRPISGVTVSVASSNAGLSLDHTSIHVDLCRVICIPMHRVLLVGLVLQKEYLPSR